MLCESSIFKVLTLSVLFLIFTFSFAHGQWIENGVPVAVGSEARTNLDVAEDTEGGLLVTWAEIRPPADEEDIFAQKIDALGQVHWSANGLAICETPGEQIKPAITTDGSGGAFVCWEDHRDPDESKVFLQRVLADGTIAWALNGILIDTEDLESRSPAVVADGVGGVFVAHEKEPDHYSQGTYVYLKLIDEDGQSMWGPGIASPWFHRANHNPRLISDGVGGAILTFTSSDTYNDEFNMAATRMDPMGGVFWTIEFGYFGSNYQMSSDGMGGVLVSWNCCFYYDFFRAYALRFAHDGSFPWGDSRIPLSTQEGDQYSRGIAPDGTGGAIVAWRETDIPGRQEFYAQAISATGTFNWQTDGLPVCNADGQNLNGMVADGAGGVILSWANGSAPDRDIHAQKMAADGSCPWSGPAPICTSAGDQGSDWQIVSDGAAGALFAWIDGRNHPTEIYAQRINQYGAWGPDPAAVEDETIPLPGRIPDLVAYPNPFNPLTRIDYSIGHDGPLELAVYDSGGRLVRVLAKGWQQAGPHAALWNGTDASGRRVGSGVYLLKLVADNQVIQQKVMLLK